MNALVTIVAYVLAGIIVTITVSTVRDFVVEFSRIRKTAKYSAVTTGAFTASWSVIVFTWVSVAILSGLAVNIPKTAITGIVTAIFAAVGLGSQKIIGDIMAGFTMLIERQARVGDTVSVSIDGKIETGTVTKITLRTMSVATDVSGIVIIPNGKITYIVNETITAGRFLIRVPFSTESLVDKIDVLVDKVQEAADGSEKIRSALVDDGLTSRRVTTLENGVIEVSFVGTTKPGMQYETKRRLNEIIVDMIEKTDGVALAPTGAMK